MKRNKITVFAAVLFLFNSLSYCRQMNNNAPSDLSVFYAAFFSPVMNSVKGDSEKALNIQLRTEVSGSQVVIRKVTELKRDCDIMISADQTLFEKMAADFCSWRIDFANDEMVLGIGIRAPGTDQAEGNPVPVLLNKNTILNRTDENLSPIGYRTLMVWKLMEQDGNPGLSDKLTGKSGKPVDDVEHLAALLKTGDADYGFIYKTTAVEQQIRYIALDKNWNLGDNAMDYSRAVITFQTKQNGLETSICMKGTAIIYSLSVPKNAPNPDKAIEWIRYLLKNKSETFKEYGMNGFIPKFHGNKKEYEKFKDFCVYSGEF